jgi:hypothetical protein
MILIPFYRGTGKNPKTFPLHFCSFLRKSRVVAWKQEHCAEKASAGKEIHAEIPPHFRRMRRAHRALPNSEFGMWNSEFLLLFFHSAFRNRHSAFQLPARSKTSKVPHGFFAQGPCFQAGQGPKINSPHNDSAKSEGAQALKKEASRKEIFLLFLLPLAESRSSFPAAWADFQNRRFLGSRPWPFGGLFPLRLLGLFLAVGPIAEEHDAGQHGEDQAGPVEEAQEEGNRLLPEGNFEMDRP